MSKTHQQIKVLRISFVLYELFQKFRYLLLFKRSLNIFYQRRIKVISMMNDELFKNFTISCNHAIGTTQSYELSLRKYCIYFDMSLKELLEKLKKMRWNVWNGNTVGWNQNWLNTGITCFKTMLQEPSERKWTVSSFFTSSMTLRYGIYLRSMTKASRSLLLFILRKCRIRKW